MNAEEGGVSFFVSKKETKKPVLAFKVRYGNDGGVDFINAQQPAKQGEHSQRECESGAAAAGETGEPENACMLRGDRKPAFPLPSSM